MDQKTKIRIAKVVRVIRNSEKKIDDYKKKKSGKNTSSQRNVLEIKIEIEQLRIEMKKREIKLIDLASK